MMSDQEQMAMEKTVVKVKIQMDTIGSLKGNKGFVMVRNSLKLAGGPNRSRIRVTDVRVPSVAFFTDSHGFVWSD